MSAEKLQKVISITTDFDKPSNKEDMDMVSFNSIRPTPYNANPNTGDTNPLDDGHAPHAGREVPPLAHRENSSFTSADGSSPLVLIDNNRFYSSSPRAQSVNTTPVPSFTRRAMVPASPNYQQAAARHDGNGDVRDELAALGASDNEPIYPSRDVVVRTMSPKSPTEARHREMVSPTSGDDSRNATQTYVEGRHRDSVTRGRIQVMSTPNAMSLNSRNTSSYGGLNSNSGAFSMGDGGSGGAGGGKTTIVSMSTDNTGNTYANSYTVTSPNSNNNGGGGGGNGNNNNNNNGNDGDSSEEGRQMTTEEIRVTLDTWRRPLSACAFRDWYMFHFCNDYYIEMLQRIQRLGHPFEKVVTFYFHLWSFTGEAEFYLVFIPTLVWIGDVSAATHCALLLGFSQVLTGCMKDAGYCPRPPCPPIQIRGRKVQSKEYGFPSTHSSHSAVFSFFFYHLLCRFFPNHAGLCFWFTIFYFMNVCFSRLYLGMHWIADLVAGWVCAFVIILFNTNFVNDWVTEQLTRKSSPWWVYVLIFILLYAVPAFHATPHESCPCYMDSVRFTAVVCGAMLGLLFFECTTGDASVKVPKTRFIDEFTWAFLGQWLVCIVVLVAVKEGTSFAASKALKPVFMFLSGAYASKMPRWSRRAYIWMARGFGLLATDNNISCYEKYIEAAQINSRLYPDCACGSPLVFPAHSRNVSGVPDAMDSAISANSLANKQYGSGVPMARQESSSGRPVSPGGPNDLTAEQFAEREGFLTKDQVWPLRTHRHWWLWEVHERTVSYFCTGLVISFVAPVILRYVFGVGVHDSAAGGGAGGGATA